MISKCGTEVMILLYCRGQFSQYPASIHSQYPATGKNLSVRVYTVPTSAVWVCDVTGDSGQLLYQDNFELNKLILLIVWFLN